MMTEKESILNDLMTSFGKTVYPGDDRLITHPCAECNRLAASLKGLNWQQIPRELPRIINLNNLGFISLISQEGFLYFLPGFITAILKDYIGSANVVDSVIRKLVQPRPGDLKNMVGRISGESKEIAALKAELLSQEVKEEGMEFREMKSSMSGEQKKAVLRALRFLKNHYPDDDPMDQINRAIADIEKDD